MRPILALAAGFGVPWGGRADGSLQAGLQIARQQAEEEHEENLGVALPRIVERFRLARGQLGRAAGAAAGIVGREMGVG
ncbi:MAG: hypothetical protein OXE40_09270, partial [Gammaproteobacteria bacterium]|nr:hypothetical protein [Gammaproteobacteria bacterium]